MEELQKLMDDIRTWSDEAFGDSQRTMAIVHHLKKEVDELLDSISKEEAAGYDNSVGIGEYSRQVQNAQMEFADCFMLILDAASHFDIDAEELFKVTRKKLEINKKRRWGKPDKNGVVEHIK